MGWRTTDADGRARAGGLTEKEKILSSRWPPRMDGKLSERVRREWRQFRRDARTYIGADGRTFLSSCKREIPPDLSPVGEPFKVNFPSFDRLPVCRPNSFASPVRSLGHSVGDTASAALTE